MGRYQWFNIGIYVQMKYVENYLKVSFVIKMLQSAGEKKITNGK